MSETTLTAETAHSIAADAREQAKLANLLDCRDRAMKGVKKKHPTALDFFHLKSDEFVEHFEDMIAQLRRKYRPKRGHGLDLMAEGRSEAHVIFATLQTGYGDIAAAVYAALRNFFVRLRFAQSLIGSSLVGPKFEQCRKLAQRGQSYKGPRCYLVEPFDGETVLDALARLGPRDHIPQFTEEDILADSRICRDALDRAIVQAAVELWGGLSASSTAIAKKIGSSASEVHRRRNRIGEMTCEIFDYHPHGRPEKSSENSGLLEAFLHKSLNRGGEFAVSA